MNCDVTEAPMVKITEGRIPILTLLENSVIVWLQREFSAPRNKFFSQQGGRWWWWRVEEVRVSRKLGTL